MSILGCLLFLSSRIVMTLPRRSSATRVPSQESSMTAHEIPASSFPLCARRHVDSTTEQIHDGHGIMSVKQWKLVDELAAGSRLEYTKMSTVVGKGAEGNGVIW
ncbi:hypothetical protein DFS33DRAFT_1122288 [Desarmillaria ectypa]|nr:hypothetical protein DFS33DRAFT_1122288 [Desarmillaria ectypa]